MNVGLNNLTRVQINKFLAQNYSHCHQIQIGLAVSV